MDMGCMILRGSRDAQVLARVLCCRDAQIWTSFAHLDHLKGCGHVHPCCRLRRRKRTTTLPSQFKNMSSRTNWKQKTTGVLFPQIKRCTSTRAVASTAKNPNSLHLIDRGGDHGQSTICSWICGTVKIRCNRRTSESNVTQVL